MTRPLPLASCCCSVVRRSSPTASSPRAARTRLEGHRPPRHAGITTPPASSPDLVLLGALQSNPVTAPYHIGTAMRGGRVVLWGKVGTKYVHDVAVRIAIDLGFRSEMTGPSTRTKPMGRRVPGGSYRPCREPLGRHPPIFLSTTLVWPGRRPILRMEPPLVSYPPWWPSVAGRQPIEWPHSPTPDCSVIPRPIRGRCRSRGGGPGRARPDFSEGDGRDDHRFTCCDPSRAQSRP